MAKLLAVHPHDPQPRLLKQAAQVLSDGGVIAYPTDSAYALGCQLGNKEALERIRVIRDLHEDHHMTLVCRDLSELSTYATARLNAVNYRLYCDQPHQISTKY